MYILCLNDNIPLPNPCESNAEDEPITLIQQGTTFTDVVSKQSSQILQGTCSANEVSQPIMASEEISIIQVTHSAEKQKQPVPPPVVIDLLSDDESEPDKPESNKKVSGECPYSSIWHYLDPQGITQGPFSLMKLKEWRDSNYFGPGFTIWKSGQSPKDAVLLAGVLGRILPS